MKQLIALILFAGISQAQAETINCHGTEPFWGAIITSDKLSLEGVTDEENVSIDITGVSAAAGYSTDFVKAFSNMNGPVATVISKTCDDSMSDFDYPQQVVIYLGSKVLYGCCGKGVPIEQ